MKQRLSETTWCEESKEYRELKYDPSGAANGVLWITLADFVSHFSSVFVCRLLSDWHCVAHPDRWVTCVIRMCAAHCVICTNIP